MTTGARRGELCALRRSHLDRRAGVLRVPRSLSGSRRTMREKDTKTHQQRRVALGAESLAILDDLLNRQDRLAAEIDAKIRPDAYLFSLDPDCANPLVPDSVTQRYDRMVERLASRRRCTSCAITTPLNSLRPVSI